MVSFKVPRVRIVVANGTNRAASLLDPLRRLTAAAAATEQRRGRVDAPALLLLLLTPGKELDEADATADRGRQRGEEGLAMAGAEKYLHDHGHGGCQEESGKGNSLHGFGGDKIWKK